MKFSDILKRIGDKKKVDISESTIFTKPAPKPKRFEHIKDNISQKPDYNYMGDLLELPKTKEGMRYLLVVTDLWTDEFDIEALNNKQPETVLDAFKKMMKRKYLSQPQKVFATDAGTEFKGSFTKWLYNQNIFHKVARPKRHIQQGPVEMLNKQISELLTAYMNKMEEDTGEVYREWTDIVPEVREELNKFRKEKVVKKQKEAENKEDPILPESKWKVGDLVYFKSDVPLNALGRPQPTENFRVGDYRWNIKEPRKIEKIFWFKDSWRYMIEGIKNASYSAIQLMPAKKSEKDSKYIIMEILNKRTVKGEEQFLVWWKGFPKAKATYVTGKSLRQDAPKLVEAFLKSKGKKSKPEDLGEPEAKEEVKEPKAKKEENRKNEKEAFVEKILDRKIRKQGKRKFIDYKIRWKGYKAKDDTWEPRARLMEDVPEIVKQYEKNLKKK
jgi:hypothetical protein